jgi:hypothetical protein
MPQISFVRKVDGGQGDRIGRMFAQRVIVNFGDFSAEVVHIFWAGCFFLKVQVMHYIILILKNFGQHFGRHFPQAHLVTLISD